MIYFPQLAVSTASHLTNDQFINGLFVNCFVNLSWLLTATLFFDRSCFKDED